MKRYFKLIIVVLTAIFIESCQKEKISAVLPTQPAQEETRDNYKGLIFNATLENTDNTKTTIEKIDGAYKVKWESTDSISINGVIFKAIPQSNPADAIFTKMHDEDADPVAPYTAYYPATIYDSTAKKATLPMTQFYENEGSIAGVLPMYATTDSDLTLNFKNLCGVLKFTLTGTENIECISVFDEAKALSGPFTVNANSEAVLGYGADYGVTLLCTPPLTLNENKGKDFYVAVPAETYEHLHLQFFTENHSKSCKKQASGNAIVARNKVYSFVMEPYFVPEYFCFTSVEAGAVVSMNKNGDTAPSVSLLYSTDGMEWNTFIVGETQVTLTNVNDKVFIKAGSDNNTFANDFDYNYFDATKKVDVSGNIMYLLNGNEPANTMNDTNAMAFFGLFGNMDKTLVNAKELLLPANTLAYMCYTYMFGYCEALVTGPDILADTMAPFCCYGMFYNSGIIEAPEIHATKMAQQCCHMMFQECTSLTHSPSIPASTLANHCYYNMFNGCTSLTDAPDLPATSLADYCYSSMFNGCTSLTVVPDLPATTLAGACYSSMFNGCTSLTDAPDLPATTLAGACYSSMFNGCTSLTDVPDLPATTLADHCYSRMFNGCTSLINAPELPAMTLVNSCYYEMFDGCTSLMNAPELPATTLDIACYYGMFDGCSSLSQVTIGATNGFGYNSLYNWLKDAGTSVTNPTVYVESGMSKTIDNYTPDNWIVREPTPDCFCITSVNGPATVSMKQINSGGYPAPEIELEYSFDLVFWSDFNVDQTTINLSKGGEKVYIKAKNINDALGAVHEGEFSWNEFNFSGDIAVSGNIMYLLKSNNPHTVLTSESQYAFYGLFKDCTTLLDASNLSLPASILSGWCYAFMFSGCTRLLSAPALPASSLALSCYTSMFRDCSCLTSSPELPAVSMKNTCYAGMFYGCTSLKSVPFLPATTLADHCYAGMFSNCSSLKSIPDTLLPSTTLAKACYSNMFEGCTGLTCVPNNLLPATSLSERCYGGMFNGCSGLTIIPDNLLPATTLAASCYAWMFHLCTGLKSIPENLLPASTLTEKCYQIMFADCTSLTSIPENLLPATTLAEECYESMFGGCSGITKIPEHLLPANTMEVNCYDGMFEGCKSLTTAPILPATTLAQGCYLNMFYGCSKLNYVKALFTTTPSDTYTKDWLYNVSSTGIFVKSKDASWNITGSNGIPSGWTVYTE